jgi:uncharacterized integral membrane protein (TIGR00697 family)
MAKDQNELSLLPIVTGIFVTILILTPPLDSKFIAVGRFAVPGATVIFPLAFIFNDVLTEVYGYERSRRIIWTGLACQVLAAVSFWLVGRLPAAGFWHNDQAYATTLGIVPRIAGASLLAYFCGEFANSLVLSRMKFTQHGRTGRPQWLRFLVSTIVGEAIDSVVFISVAFAGVLSTRDLLETTTAIYVIKVGYEIVALPLSTRLANWMKRREGFDKLDDPSATVYNPFRLAVTRGE